MLTSHDDLLCHQLPRPFESVAQSDPNWIERIHFPCASLDGRYIVDVGFGYYPNRDVMDGFAGVADGTRVRYLRGSRRLRPRADEVFVGPLRWEVLRGLQELRCTLDTNDQGIAWDLVFSAGFPPSEEEFHRTWRNGRLVEEQTRFYQMGRLSGWLEIDGERVEVTPERWTANRDRSWGVRQAMQPDPTMAPPAPRSGGLYTFAYIQFDGWAVQHYRTEDAAGRTTFHMATRYFPDHVEALADMAHTAEFLPGGIEVKAGTYCYTTSDGAKLEMTYERDGAVFPLGAVGGYSSFGGFFQGKWMGEEWLDTGHLDLADPADLASVRGLMDYSCSVRCGDKVGRAIVEVLPLPPYQPYGF